MSLEDCQVITIQTLNDKQGKLSFLEENVRPNFLIKRIYYLYDMHNEAQRGNHVYTNVRQIIVPITGQFKIMLDDGKNKKEFCLASANQGIYIPQLIWRSLYQISLGTILLVLTDQLYKDSKCIKNYAEFQRLII